MNGKKITVKIDPLGNPVVEAHGFQGTGCAEATKSIEDALAAGTGGMTRVEKDAWHESETTVHEQHNEW